MISVWFWVLGVHLSILLVRLLVYIKQNGRTYKGSGGVVTWTFPQDKECLFRTILWYLLFKKLTSINWIYCSKGFIRFISKHVLQNCMKDFRMFENINVQCHCVCPLLKVTSAVKH